MATATENSKSLRRLYPGSRLEVITPIVYFNKQKKNIIQLNRRLFSGHLSLLILWIPLLMFKNTYNNLSEQIIAIFSV